MRCMVPRPAPTHKPCLLRGPSRARGGLDPDGPPGGLWPLRHGRHQTAGLLGTECRSPSACRPQEGIRKVKLWLMTHLVKLPQSVKKLSFVSLVCPSLLY